MSGDYTAPPAATFVSRHDGFSKKSIEQLGVIKELNALVCLSGKFSNLFYEIIANRIIQ